MNLLAGYFRRIENSIPIFIRPSGGADANCGGRLHREDDRRLAHETSGAARLSAEEPPNALDFRLKFCNEAKLPFCTEPFPPLRCFSSDRLRHDCVATTPKQRHPQRRTEAALHREARPRAVA